ncbi:putative DNA-binding protein (UPF0251 family) [Geothermobacter ehrlichii]|uniref:Putative DNA-binding protein (UPF0251 family) n=1 Tax=Geothermobacter ehrlichii TaxID=213224 RepID=A0A5D3WMR8_9BACT|nr:DUF134 domain-containing protein [Geothermobacter ehrlichii]TYO99356.1 putative DNA-binding protein (UPF0251 family) [Geothermobacter ehrlichii]
MTPRPRKPRNCCCVRQEFGSLIFKPAGTPLKELETTTLYPDETEALHLCDSLGLTQQQAGERMGVSRGTVQRLVAGGRKKLIDALLEGRAVLLTAEEPGTSVESPAES